MSWLEIIEMVKRGWLIKTSEERLVKPNYWGQNPRPRLNLGSSNGIKHKKIIDCQGNYI